tara:strand:+ start:414 stop:1979 length:1566 start_codon:yes stop_codon:yes gene_type:complete
MVVGVAIIAINPTWFSYLHVAAAIILSTFWCWFMWLLFSPPSVLRVFSKGKRHKSFGKLIKKKTISPSWEMAVFYIGLIVIFVACFSLSFFLQDLCVDFYPLDTSTKFSRSGSENICEDGEGLLSPCHVYLTVPERMDTRMIVNFHTLRETPNPRVYYDVVSHADVPFEVRLNAYAFSVEATQIAMTAVHESTRFVAWADLTNLLPNTRYYFIAGNGTNESYYTQERFFVTAPTVEPYTFSVGGDLGLKQIGYDLLSDAASYDPLFISICGDLVYDQGMPYCYKRWDVFFQRWDAQVRGSDGRVIPMMTCAGNHEGGWDIYDPARNAAFLQPYFPHSTGLQEVPVYSRSTIHSHTIGTRTHMIVLDSGHWLRAEKQVEYLREQLQKARAEGRFALPTYHVGQYRSDASARSEDNTMEMRRFWGPLFDEYNVPLAFEEHDHTYKRTYPLRNGQAAANGTVYLGDGAIGVDPEARGEWKGIFFQSIGGVRHIGMVTVTLDTIEVNNLNADGDIFDPFIIIPEV